MNNNNRDGEFNNFIDPSDNNSTENTGFKVSSDEFDISSNDSEDVLDLNAYFKEEGLVFNDVDISSDSKPKNKKGGKASDRSGKSGVSLFGFLFIPKGVANMLKAILAVLMVLVIIACAGVGAIVGYVFLSVDGTMDVDLTKLELDYATTVYSQNDKGEWVEYQRLHGAENRVWVDYNKDLASAKAEGYEGVPQDLADAFVAIEDKRFFDHEGVDWRRTISAFVTMVTNRTTSGHGGSSITQQLVKNLTKDADRSASRKVREIMRARYLEKEFAKEVILECYMNTIAMGNGIYGVEVAAEYYFGKNVSELTLAECASIAGITNIPEYYRPDINPENNLKRRNLVLSLMRDQKLITEEEYEQAKAEELVVVGDKTAMKEAPINNYFIDALIDDVVVALMDEYAWDRKTAEENFYNGGYKIYSTVKPEIQSAIDSVYSDPKYSIPGKKAPLQGSMVVMDYKGNVLGMAGGIGEKTENRGLNRALMSPRQPGSTIKPISAYAPAIERGLITYSSIVDDSSVYYNNNTWRPTNWYLSYKGKVTVKYALEISMNTIPVYLVDLLTLQKSYDFLTKDLGITGLTKNDIDYSPLGMGGTNGGLTTLESAAAFAVFGNGGRYYEPITYTQIYDQFGELIVTQESKMRVAISDDTATIMNKLLQNVVYGSEGTGGGARSYVPNMKVYAKTGTSNNANDLWFVGGTPYYVASAWCGYDQLEAIRGNSAIAQRMWGGVMSQIHKNLPAKNFNFSKDVQCKLYCSETGLLANTGCPISGYGWYKTSDNAYCEAHTGDKIGGTTEAQAKENLAKYKKETGTPVGGNNTPEQNPEDSPSSGGEGSDPGAPTD